MNSMTLRTEQLKRLKSYNLTLTKVDIQSSSDDGNQISIRGPGEFEIIAQKDIQGNYSKIKFNHLVNKGND